MDEIRGSPARRLSQILDPIARLTSELSSSTSAPCSPRMGSRRHESCCAATSSSGPSSLGDSPRMIQRRGGRLGPTPPPRPRLSNNSPVHYRDSPYVNVPNLVFEKDKSFAESAKNAGYMELKESPPGSAGLTPPHNKSRTSPFNFTSEPSGRVEYVDTRLPFVDFGPTSYENKAHELQAYARGRSPFEPTTSTASCSSRSPFFGRQQADSQSRTVIHQDGTQPEPKPTFASSKSFDGYANTVEELNWQERCLELQLELHRSRNQASRVRDMLREKILANKEFDPNLIDLIEKGKNAETKLLLQDTSNQLQDSVDDTGSTLLHYAVKFNNVEMIRHLVHLGYKYDSYNNEGDTPLMLAVANNRTDLVGILLKRINVSCSDNHLRKLLEIMFDREKLPPEIVKSILEKLKKADDETITRLLLEAKCPLYYAVFLNRVAVVKAMIDDDCSVNVKDPSNGNSPLHVAVACGNSNLVRLLVKHGAEVNAVNNKGEIALNREEEYCSREELEILKILVEKESLLTSRDNSGRMQIFRVFQHGNVPAMKIVLRSSIDLNAQDSDGNTVIHYTASNMKTDISSLLMKRNFDPNIQNRWGLTPLHFMAFKHDLRAIRLLFEKGADVNKSREDGVPPLHNLIVSYRSGRNMSTDCVREFLVERGADIQYVTNNDHTVLNALNFSKGHILSGIIVPHLALLEAQGTTIVETFRRQIDSTDWVKCGIESCRSKLERLKTVEVHESITIFNLLIDSERRIISYLRNKQLTAKLRRVFNSKNHGIHWWHFEILKKRVNKALDIIKWQQKATLAFCTNIGNHIRFADFIINEVMVYLSLEDIKNLASVKCADRNSSKRKLPQYRKSTGKRKCQVLD